MKSSGHQFPLRGAGHAGYFKSHFANPNLYENGMPAVALTGYATEALFSPSHTIDFAKYRDFYFARFLRTSLGSEFEFCRRLNNRCVGWTPYTEDLPFCYEIVYHFSPQTAALAVTGGDRLLQQLCVQKTQDVIRRFSAQLPGGAYGTMLSAVEPHNRVLAPDLHAHYRLFGACVKLHKSFHPDHPFYEWVHVARPRLPQQLVRSITAELKKAEIDALHECGYRTIDSPDRDFGVWGLSPGIPYLIRLRHYAAAVAVKALEGPLRTAISDAKLDAAIGELYAIANAAEYIRPYIKLALPQPIVAKISRDGIGSELCFKLEWAINEAVSRTRPKVSALLSGPRVLKPAQRVDSGVDDEVNASMDLEYSNEVVSHRDFGPQTIFLRDRRDGSLDPLSEFQHRYPEEANHVGRTVQMVILVIEGLARAAVAWGHPVMEITELLDHCGKDTPTPYFTYSGGGMRKVRQRLSWLADNIVQAAFQTVARTRLLQRGVERLVRRPFDIVMTQCEGQECLLFLLLLRDLSIPLRYDPGVKDDFNVKASPLIPHRVPVLPAPHWSAQSLLKEFLQQEPDLDRKINKLLEELGDPPKPGAKKLVTPPNLPPPNVHQIAAPTPKSPSGAKQTPPLVAQSAATIPTPGQQPAFQKITSPSLPKITSPAVPPKNPPAVVSPAPVTTQSPPSVPPSLAPPAPHETSASPAKKPSAPVSATPYLPGVSPSSPVPSFQGKPPRRRDVERDLKSNSAGQPSEVSPTIPSKEELEMLIRRRMLAEPRKQKYEGPEI